MNIEEYRAMKTQLEQEAQNADSKVEQTAEEVEVITPEVKTEEPIKIDNESKTNENKIVIDGEEVDIKDVTEWKRGYLRNSDYTKKTQELSQARRELNEAVSMYEQLKTNPPTNQQSFQGQSSNENEKPVFLRSPAKQIEALESKVSGLMLQIEVADLERKYPDFDAKAVLEVAKNRGINDLEDAYLLHKSLKPSDNNLDIEALKEQIRQELVKEMEDEVKSTKSIITSGGTSDSKSVKSDKPKLSPQELKVATAFNMTEDEYLGYKNNMRGK